MASVILSNRQRIDLENFMLHAPSARECCRAQAVLWLAEGEPADQVAECLHVSRQTVYNGWIPEKCHAAIVSSCSEVSGCDAGGLIGTPEFNSASMSGAFHCQCRWRSVAIVACTCSIVSSHRPVNAAARSTSIASAFSSRQ